MTERDPIDQDTIDCWRANYGLDKTPHELLALWHAGAPTGAVLALKAAIGEIERLRDTLSATWRTVDTAPADKPLVLYCPQRHETNPSRVEVGVFRDTRGGHEHAWATHWMPLPVRPNAKRT